MFLPSGAKVMNMKTVSSMRMSVPANAVTKTLSLEAGLNTENEVVVQDNPEVKMIIKPTLIEAGPPAKYKLEIQRPSQPGMPVNFPMMGIQTNEQKEAVMMQSLNLNGKMMNLLMKVKPTLLESPTDGNNGKVKLSRFGIANACCLFGSAS